MAWKRLLKPNEARVEIKLALAMPCKKEEAKGKKLSACARKKRKDGKTSTERAARAEATLALIMPSRKRGRRIQS